VELYIQSSICVCGAQKVVTLALTRCDCCIHIFQMCSVTFYLSVWPYVNLFHIYCSTVNSLQILKCIIINYLSLYLIRYLLY